MKENKNILFIDSAYGTRILLNKAGKFKYACDNNLKGSETLMPLIDSVLKAEHLAVTDLDIIGGAIGAGSFTGLRIGLATIKALCYVTGAKSFGITNMRLIAYNNISAHSPVAVATAAGNGICYFAVFDGAEEVVPCKCVKSEDVLSYLKDNKCVLSTDGKAVSSAQDIAELDRLNISPRIYEGENEMKLALADLTEFVDASQLSPLYIRKAQPMREAGDL